jgi:hypothetical protein
VLVFPYTRRRKVEEHLDQQFQQNYTASYNPHHLLPADATWPNTELKKWIHKGKVVRDNIGYDVNCYENGIDLPSNNAMRGNWTPDAGRSGDFQVRYAFAAMDAEGSTRQFHDSHKSYSDFAIKVLDKIAAKLDGKEHEGNLGCGDPKCSAEKAKKPYPVPIYVGPRILGVSQRLSRYLYGSPRKWRMPIMTSKFSLMYKNRKLTQAQATAALSPDNF